MFSGKLFKKHIIGKIGSYTYLWLIQQIKFLDSCKSNLPLKRICSLMYNITHNGLIQPGKWQEKISQYKQYSEVSAC